MTVWNIWTTLFTMFSKFWGWFAWPVLSLPFPYWFICYLWSSHRCIWSDELQTYKWWAGSCLCLSLSLWIKLERTPNPATILRLFWVINFGHFFCFLTNVVIFARNPWLFLVMLNFVVIVVIHSGSFCHKDSQGKLLEFFLRIIWMNFTTVYLTGKPGFN